MNKYQLIIFAVITLVLLIVFFNLKTIKYLSSPYYRATGKHFSHVKSNVGEYGEYIVFNNLLRIRGKKLLLANLYIKIGEEKYTEIDVIMIHTSGIYVVESKNYKGHISGYPAARMWTQSLGKNIENKFYNPMQQNQTHIRALKKVLGCDISVLHSVIAFNDNSDLSDIHTDNDDTVITTIKDINKDISKLLRKNRNTLSAKKISEFYKILNEFSHARRKIRRRHLKYVKKRSKK